MSYFVLSPSFTPPTHASICDKYGNQESPRNPESRRILNSSEENVRKDFPPNASYEGRHLVNNSNNKFSSTSHSSSVADSIQYAKKVIQPQSLRIQSIEQTNNRINQASINIIMLGSHNISDLNQILGSETSLAVSLLWADNSNNHAVTTQKLCVPSKPCNNWNCPCERYVRQQQTLKPLKGICIASFPSSDTPSYFYLPFGDFLDCRGSIVLPRSASLDIVSLSSIILSLLFGSNDTIIYNSQIVLMALVQNFADIGCSKLANLKVFDPKIAEYLLHSDISDTDLELASLVQRHKLTSDSTARRHIVLDAAHHEEALHVDIFNELQLCFELFTRQRAELDMRQMLPVLYRMEGPLCLLLALMEVCGVCIDRSHLLRPSVSVAVKENIAAIVASVQNMVNQPFLNLASPEQVSRLLFEDLKLPKSNDFSSSASRKRKYASTSEQDLTAIIDAHPVVNQILKFRTLSKIQSTYIDGIKPFIIVDPLGGHHRVHANWNLTSVRTGRISCSKPNLQNIPTSVCVEGIPVDIRSAFVASEG